MNKRLAIIISVIILMLIGLGWFILSRDSTSPIIQTIKNVLPFGSGGENVPFNDGSGNATSSALGEDGKPLPVLFQLSDTPVAGAVAFTKNGFTTVRYVERATGHIIDVDPNTLAKTKIVNTTRPKIYEAYFKPDASQVLYRSLLEDSDSIQNISLTLTAPKSTSTDEFYIVSAIALRGSIGEIATTPNGLYFVQNDTSSIVSSDFNGVKVQNIFTSAFRDWRLEDAGSKILVWTKASASADGYAYFLNTNGSLTKLLGPLLGLTATTDNTGSFLAYSYNNSGRTDFFVENIKTSSISPIFPSTLAEKCVWSEKEKGILFCGTPTTPLGNNEPDNWYQGKTHTSDSLWRFDTASGISDILAEPAKSLGVNIDVLAPQISPDEDYLIFINKNDLSLWALKLKI